MANNEKMMAQFQALKGAERQQITARLGKPAISLPDMDAWLKQEHWLVLHYGEGKVSAATFFTKDGELQWSCGIHLLPADTKPGNSISAFAEHFGPPHGNAGSGVNCYHYLTEDGNLLTMHCYGDIIRRVNATALADCVKK